MGRKMKKMLILRTIDISINVEHYKKKIYESEFDYQIGVKQFFK